jgi:DNA-binding transcriptional ArsR family regulator
MNQEPSIFNCEADLFAAMAHPCRLEILELLREGECCVCHIQAMLDYRQAYISQHLNILRQAGLISSRKDGQRMYYSLSNPGMLAIIDSARECLQSLGKWHPDTQNKSGLDKKKKICHCPQCSPKEINPESSGGKGEYAFLH